MGFVYGFLMVVRYSVSPIAASHPWKRIREMDFLQNLWNMNRVAHGTSPSILDQLISFVHRKVNFTSKTEI